MTRSELQERQYRTIRTARMFNVWYRSTVFRLWPWAAVPRNPLPLDGEMKQQHVMTLVRFKSSPVSSASPVDRLASEIFGQGISNLLGNDGDLDHAPRVNIVESKDDYRVEVQAPGFDKKDLKVEMLADTLTIRGEHTEENTMENGELRYTRREFSRNAFERSFVLPQTANADAIEAEYVNGVLRLTIPKSEESKPKSRRISIG